MLEPVIKEPVAAETAANKPAPRFVSLRVRLLRPLIWLSLLAAAVGSFGIYMLTTYQLKQELQLRGQMLSGAIVIAAETSSSLVDLQRSILAMAGEPNIDSITLVDTDFKPIFRGETFNADTHPDERQELNSLAQQALTLKASLGAIDRHNSGIYQVVTPVHISALPHKNALQPEPALLIVNLLTAEAQHKAVNTTLLLTLLFTSLGITALAMIYYLMNQWVLKPSLKIVGVMQQQSLKQTASTGFAPIHELGLIGQTFDQLSHTLAAREEALEQALVTAQDASVAKSQFLANMSHELRTPMNAILGMLALLQKTNLNNRQADYTLKTEGAARSLLSLLNDILDISKAEAGKMVLDPTPFNLDHLTRDLTVILSTNLTDKPVELAFNIAPELPRYFKGDAMRLQQILINLGSNAIKFTERGHVTITIALQAQHADTITLQFSVQDSGIGIAPENQAKIFSGFTQAEASTTRRFGGTGLGLAISQRLVALMGGTLQLESSIGQGSRFFFNIHLPELTPNEITQFTLSLDNVAQVTGQLRLQNMRVLLVEDNLNNQQIALELLSVEGAKVQIANHGQEALDIIKANTSKTGKVFFDAVLMDLQMPVMDGINATLAIRNELGLADLPIIAMTANAMASDRELCLNAGMNDHVGKPFDLHHLVNVLREQAGWQHAAEAATQAATSNNSQAIPATQEVATIQEVPTIQKVPTTQEIQKEPNRPPETSGGSETPQDIAEQHGIELKNALARLGGNQAFYLKMLPKFIASLESLPEKLNALLAAGDFPTLARELHSLKGLAATMGATAIATLAAHTEKQLLAQPTAETAQLIITQVCAAIATDLPPLNRLLQSMENQ